MLGTHNPIPVWRGQEIHLNVIQMQEVAGKCSCSLIVSGLLNPTIGEQVKVITYTTDDHHSTGLWCIRYIVALQLLNYNEADISIYQVQLSPFKPNELGQAKDSGPNVSGLGLSGVRNRDNLESF
jgi:hypothetical protein